MIRSEPVKREPLKSVIDSHYNQRDIVTWFLLEAIKAYGRRQLSVYYSEEFYQFEVVTRALRRQWYAPMPSCNPKFFPEGDAFWLMCCEPDDGEIVFTMASRLFVLSDKSLQEAFEDLSIFYSDPARMASPKEECICTAPSAPAIGGRLAFSSGFWVSPDWRRKAGWRGFSELGPQMAWALALLKWNMDYDVAVVEQALVDNGTARLYGYQRIENSVSWNGSYYGADYEMCLAYLDRSEIMRRIWKLMRLSDAVLPRRETQQPPQAPRS